MFTVVVINAKGGAGKTTLVSNLASYYACHGFKTAIQDYDSQGSSTFWLKKRPDDLPPIQSIPMFEQVHGSTSSFAHQPERGTECLLIDTPSGVDTVTFKPVLEQADVILIPVLPSSIDIHAVSRFIADLLIRAKLDRGKGNIAVIANRARKNTLVYRKLEKFLESLGIPFIATLRDTQNYIKATEEGLGVMDMKGEQLFKDHKSMKDIIGWLDSRRIVSLKDEDVLA